ncbi:uncharacterized protein TNCV_4764401 [Trichonephila clavipes]|nr:uncharacterized protein TNCV_4764401 [Trichonephila clavipes]
MYGKERADFIARIVAEEVILTGSLTFREISFLKKIELHYLGRTPPSHPWYFGKKSRWFLQTGIPKGRQSSNLKLKLSGTTIHEGQELLCPSQYTWPLGAEVHEQMSRFGALSEGRPSVFKTPSKHGTHLLTQCSGDERQSRPCPAR